MNAEGAEERRDRGGNMLVRQSVHYSEDPIAHPGYVKIHQIAKPKVTHPQVAQQLCLMYISCDLNCLQFNHNLVLDQQVHALCIGNLH